MAIAAGIVGFLLGLTTGILGHWWRSRHRLTEGEKIMANMLVYAVPYLLDGIEWEDHHAVCELAQKLACDPVAAKHLLQLAMKLYPGMRVIKTDGCLL